MVLFGVVNIQQGEVRCKPGLPYGVICQYKYFVRAVSNSGAGICGWFLTDISARYYLMDMLLVSIRIPLTTVAEFASY